MKFDRVMTVALKVILVDFALLLLACMLVPPLIRKGIPTAVIGGIAGFVFALFGLAVTVYFILKAEKIYEERSPSEQKQLVQKVKELEREVKGTVQVLPESEMKSLCPKCGQEIPEGFRLCPYCGAE